MKKLLLLGLAASLTMSCSREAAPPARAATPAPKPLTAGVDPSGFDKSIRPQDDLYKFVNSAWLAKTEIPPDRGAYGGFYEAIDRTQERLREIAEEASKAANKTPGSDQQKLGDFYASFMDEARVNQLGKAPLEPELARIDALASKTDLSRHMARMLMLNMTTLVSGGVDGDAQDPGTSVLYLAQSGLGLPDRDYYLKDDPKLKEYPDEVPGLRGEDADAGRTAVPGRRRQGDRRLRDATRARALDERREPRCRQDLQQGHDGRSAEALPRHRLDRVGSRARRRQRQGGCRRAAQLFQGDVRSGRGTASRSLEAVHQVPHRQRSRAVSEQGVRRSALRFLRPHPPGRQGDAAAVETCGQQSRHRARRAARQGVRRAALQAGCQGTDGTPGREPARGLPRSDRQVGLDGARHQEGSASQARRLPPQDRVPEQMA